MKKFFVIVFSMLIMISVGAVGIKSTNIDKTETISQDKAMLSIGFTSVMDLAVDVGTSDVLIYSVDEQVKSRINQNLMFVTKLPNSRLDKKIDVGRCITLRKTNEHLNIYIDKIRSDKRVDPGISQDVSL